MFRESVTVEKEIMTNDVGRLAKLIEVLCAPRPDLRHSDGSPNASAIARAGIKRGYTLSQPTVSRILHGQISHPDTQTIQALAAVFGVSEGQLRGESDEDISPLERSIAERWGKLPPQVQDYLAGMIDQALEFVEKNPKGANALFNVRRKSRS